MLVKNICGRQFTNALRGNKFGTTVLTEEFPYREIPRVTPPAPSTATGSAKNGIRVVARNRATGSVSLKFAVLGGSSTETTEQKGAAHFLAVNAFNGTYTESGLAIVKAFDNIGATLNATVDREKIVYHVNVLPDRVPNAVAIVLAALAFPPYYNHVYEESRPKVQLGYDCLHHCPQTFLNELIHEAAFGDSTPYGNSIYASNLKALSVDAVLDYRNKHFVRENVIVAADGISSDELLGYVDKYALAKFPNGNTVNVSNKVNYTGGELKIRTWNSTQSHVAFAWSTPSGEAGQAFEVLHSTLCNRLHKKGAHKSVNLFANKYAAGGLFGVTSSTTPGNVEATFRTVVDELKAIAANAKDAEGRRTRVALNKIDELNGRCGAGSLLNAYLVGGNAEKLADTRNVTAQQVSDAAKALLQSNPSYAVLGNTSGTPSLASLKKLV